MVKWTKLTKHYSRAVCALHRCVKSCCSYGESRRLGGAGRVAWPRHGSVCGPRVPALGFSCKTHGVIRGDFRKVRKSLLHISIVSSNHLFFSPDKHLQTCCPSHYALYFIAISFSVYSFPYCCFPIYSE